MKVKLDQEIASIIKYVLDTAGNPKPYYYRVPEGFAVPSIYFPHPIMVDGNDTLRSYSITYDWFVKFFAKETQDAFELANDVLIKLCENRKRVQLINQDGSKTDQTIKLKELEIKEADEGAVQFHISWVSRKPYVKEDYQKVIEFSINGWNNPDVYVERTISTAFESAVENYLFDYELTGTKLASEEDL